MLQPCGWRLMRTRRHEASHLFLIKGQLELDVTLSHSGVYEDRAGQ
jgi:hypothetical protein